MSKREIVCCADAPALYRTAAERIIDAAHAAIQAHGRFTVALSGGSTPRRLYTLLATPAYSDRIDWSRCHLFWGDERCVAPNHTDSNYRMTEESLLSKITIPPGNIHRMAGEKEPAVGSAEYESELKKFFRLEAGARPRFDLILLGLGDDGHTASLFPAATALQESRKLVVDVYHAGLQSHRLTLTLPVLNQAEMVVFLVSGSSKAKVVQAVLHDASASDLPAALVRPNHGRLLWLLTEDAASLLPSKTYKI